MRAAVATPRSASMSLAAWHPDQFVYAGSMSGFLNPSEGWWPGLINLSMGDAGGYKSKDMWGPASEPAWQRNDPMVQIPRLVANNTRLWVYSPQAVTCTDPAAMIGFCAQAQGSNRTFYAHYRGLGGKNGYFDFPAAGNHDWGSWSAALGALANDVAAAIQ